MVVASARLALAAAGVDQPPPAQGPGLHQQGSQGTHNQTWLGGFPVGAQKKGQLLSLMVLPSTHDTSTGAPPPARQQPPASPRAPYLHKHKARNGRSQPPQVCQSSMCHAFKTHANKPSHHTRVHTGGAVCGPHTPGMPLGPLACPMPTRHMPATSDTQHTRTHSTRSCSCLHHHTAAMNTDTTAMGLIHGYVSL